MRGRLLGLSALAGMLTACPPVGDDYEVGPGASGSAGTPATGGSSGSGGSGGSAGSSGAAGSGGQTSCDPMNCAHTCCGTLCADLSSNVAHCGACDQACPIGRSCNFGKCGPSGWIAIQKTANEPSARAKSAYVWTGKYFFVWGGVDGSGADLSDGALYDPSAGIWTTVTSSTSAPSARVLATAVAVADKILVWGGGDDSNGVDYKDGGIYDPATKTWTAVSAAPAEARAAIGVWSGGAQVVFHGGFDKSDKPLDNTFVYTPATDSWTTASSAIEPPALLHPTWAKTDTDLYLYGGRPDGLDKTDLAWRASLTDGTWSSLPKGPTARFGSFGAWDETSFFVWSGSDGASVKDDGKLLTGSAWVNVGADGERPTARWAPTRRTGWTAAIGDGRFLLVGGTNPAATTFHRDGGIYEHATTSWKLVPSWAAAEDRQWAAAVWTGVELLIWGGSTQGVPSATGERYLPP